MTTELHDDSEQPQPLGLGSSEGLGPAYLGDGTQAFPAATVARWSDVNARRMTVHLFTSDQVAHMLADERQRIRAAIEEEVSKWRMTSGRARKRDGIDRAMSILTFGAW